MLVKGGGFLMEKQTVGRRELVKRVVDDTGLTREVVNKVVVAFLDQFKKSLVDGETVSLSRDHIGRFIVKSSPSHRGYNPRLRKTVFIPEHRILQFKPSPAMKKAVKEGRRS